MPIIIVPNGTNHTIVRIAGDEKVKKHLRSLGISEGATVEVLSRENGGVILRVLGSRLALDREISRCIFVA